jgi:F0F1-type ATP synthase membrane subunit b/b'
VKSEVAEKLEAGRKRIAEEAKTAQSAIRTDAEKIADSIAASILKG